MRRCSCIIAQVNEIAAQKRSISSLLYHALSIISDIKVMNKGEEKRRGFLKK